MCTRARTVTSFQRSYNTQTLRARVARVLAGECCGCVLIMQCTTANGDALSRARVRWDYYKMFNTETHKPLNQQNAAHVQPPDMDAVVLGFFFVLGGWFLCVLANRASTSLFQSFALSLFLSCAHARQKHSNKPEDIRKLVSTCHAMHACFSLYCIRCGGGRHLLHARAKLHERKSELDHIIIANHKSSCSYMLLCGPAMRIVYT